MINPIHFGKIVSEKKKTPHKGGYAESQNRTGDTAIFSRVLYQLSYLGLSREILHACVVLVKQYEFDSGAGGGYNQK